MKKKKFGLKPIIIINVIVALIYLAPLYWTFITSIKEKLEIYATPPSLIPKSFSLANYTKIFTINEGIYLKYFFNSVKIAVITVTLVCLVSVLAGYAFSKLELIGKEIWMTLILLAIMVPFSSLMVPLFNIMSDLKLLNSQLSLIFIYTTFQTPFCIFMMKNSFDMIPRDLRDAAMIDGAGYFKTFYEIYIPLVLSGVVTIAVYSAYTTWNDYLIALVFANTNTKTFNVGLVNLALGDYGTDWGLLTSGSFIGLIPILILFMFLQKYFVKGMMSGAVK
jgi:multiple sugar transport system permease protein